MKKFNRILSAEEIFARQVALGVITTRPLTVWHYMIPFMFIFDFLRRSSIIRQYTKHFMFPRKVAMESAQEIRDGEPREKALLEAEKEIKAWLNSLNLYSEALHLSQVEVVKLLIDHYDKLLSAQGETYDDLVRNVYFNRYNYETYLSQLTSAEKQVDKAMVESLGETEPLREKILAEQEQVDKLRKKTVARIF
ncbi:MAG: NF038143 family protein [Desulfobacteraceae bacterium]|jgi:hypothetical protein